MGPFLQVVLQKLTRFRIFLLALVAAVITALLLGIPALSDPLPGLNLPGFPTPSLGSNNFIRSRVEVCTKVDVAQPGTTETVQRVVCCDYECKIGIGQNGQTTLSECTLIDDSCETRGR